MFLLFVNASLKKKTTKNNNKQNKHPPPPQLLPPPLPHPSRPTNPLLINDPSSYNLILRKDEMLSFDKLKILTDQQSYHAAAAAADDTSTVDDKY